MEEIFSESKSPENSIYVTAAIPELGYHSSQEIEVSVSLAMDNQIIQDEKAEIFEIDEKSEENSPKEEKKNEEKCWEDVNLAEASGEIILPIVCQEEYPEEKIQIIEKIIEQNSVSVKNGKFIHEGLLGMSSYYIYEIITVLQGEEFKANRRYKDFQWLYTTLKENYKGMSVPPLPPKRLSPFQDHLSNEQRRNQLEKCLEILLKHFALKNSKQLYVFLTYQDSEFQKIKENMRTVKVSFKYNNIEDAIDQIISKIQAKMNQIFSLRILPFSKDLVAIERYLTQIKITTYSLSIAFNMVQNAQQKTNVALENMHFSHSKSFYRTMQLHKHLIRGNDNELELIKHHFDEENLKIEALQGAIDDYKYALKKYSELEALIERKIIKARQHFDDTERYLIEIEDIKHKIKKLEGQVCNIEENIKNEKIWLQAERDEHLELILNKIFTLHKERYTKEEEFWLEKKHENL